MLQSLQLVSLFLDANLWVFFGDNMAPDNRVGKRLRLLESLWVPVFFVGPTFSFWGVNVGIFEVCFLLMSESWWIGECLLQKVDIWWWSCESKIAFFGYIFLTAHSDHMFIWIKVDPIATGFLVTGDFEMQPIIQMLHVTGILYLHETLTFMIIVGKSSIGIDDDVLFSVVLEAHFQFLWGGRLQGISGTVEDFDFWRVAGGFFFRFGSWLPTVSPKGKTAMSGRQGFSSIFPILNEELFSMVVSGSP